MTTYWVSQGKHWCKICKLWIQPDKQSIFNHEQGKKHKEAEAEHLKETRKASRAERKEADELQSQLAAIEKAALEQYNQVDAPARTASAAARAECAGCAGCGPWAAAGPPHAAHVELGVNLPTGWVCVRTAQGMPYYANAHTGQSSWTPPPLRPEAPPCPPEPSDAPTPCAANADGPSAAASVRSADAPLDAAPPPAMCAGADCAPIADEPHEPQVDASSGLGVWTTVAVRTVEEVRGHGQRDAESSDDEREREEHARGEDAETRAESRMRAAAGRAHGSAAGQVPREDEGGAGAKPREAWAHIVERMEEEGGAGGDEAQIDSAGLLLGDNLVAHLQSHFPSRADGGRGGPAPSGHAPPPAAAERSCGEAPPAPLEEEVDVPIEFKRRKVGAGKATNRRKVGSLDL
ncbi:hypothetical protein KFE25_013311 [Diacronema lutheri]|uniref:WW domain-containing protein n=1 Tax=Diacronema lutheri TaxID=2081491 RepID=A0A8J5XIK0_DIALT|nr:hypothetical protein KFE25_013311 [Diacronema lutheri]